MKDTKEAIRRNRDSLFTHIFARSISVRVTPHLAKTSVTPMQVTIFGLALGLVAALLGSRSIWFLGFLAAILMEASHVLDCIDGELARITNKGNPFAASMDPISDRIKDLAIILAAYMAALHSEIFDLSIFQISIVAIFSLGMWLLYMYIVDAHLNPIQISKSSPIKTTRKRIFLGLYDLFIYGSIVFWILNIFEYFLVYVIIISIVAIPIQIYRLKRLLLRSQ